MCMDLYLHIRCVLEREILKHLYVIIINEWCPLPDAMLCCCSSVTICNVQTGRLVLDVIVVVVIAVVASANPNF